MTKQTIEHAVKELKEIIAARYGQATEMRIFGSAARGAFSKESDIDVLVLVPGDINNTIEENIFELAYDIELKFSVVFGIIVYPKQFWHSDKAKAMPLFHTISKEGIAV